MPDVEAWVVDSKVENGKSFKLWMKPEMHEKLRALYPDLPDAEDISRGGGFLHGRPMLDTAITIETCGGDERPKALYRVIHSAQPFGGIKSRGHEIHMNWHCSNPSPFLSVTNSPEKVAVIAAVHQARGFKGIRILQFNPSHKSWNHNKQRLWNTKHLVDKFDMQVLKRRQYLDQEFLVEDTIPPESIQKSYSWESLRGNLDPDESLRCLMQRKVKHISLLKGKRGREIREQEGDDKGVQNLKTKRKLPLDNVEEEKDEDEEDKAVVAVKKRRVLGFKLRL
ncbi:hypothetical protein F4811DRAFT_565386 [Daldinia bambusicola]|nr:hypothetical protein F4811DRAFT_565386 [Daldinia bambusicola]